jgi:Rieske Fe-S protein
VRRRGGPRRFVEDLLRQRRPTPFSAAPRDADELRTAITLSAAKPGATAARPEFVEQLHQRLAAGLDAGPAMAGPSEQSQGPARAAGTSGSTPRPARGSETRRRVVQVTTLAAGSAAVGAGVDRVLRSGKSAGPDGVAASSSDSGAVLAPNNGVWRTVATSRDLPAGAVRPFDAGAVNGFVERSAAGHVRGVSGTCTHQGCRLVLDPAAARLNCPCHRTVFAVTGEVVRSQLRQQPRRLPELEVREIDGVVQVLVPPNPV